LPRWLEIYMSPRSAFVRGLNNEVPTRSVSGRHSGGVATNDFVLSFLSVSVDAELQLEFPFGILHM
jgi:hypothetical protein